MTATPADVLRARTGIASDIVMADGTTVEGVLLANPDAGVVRVTDWAKVTTDVVAKEIASITDTISGVTVWPVRRGTT